MSLLFDVSPEEPARPKRRRAVAATEPARPAPAARTYEATTLGRLDGQVACLDQTCRAEAHDIVEEDGGHWRLECCLCGTGQWVPARPGVLAPASTRFVFHSGRFAGLSIDEAAMQPRGMDYVRWAAAEHPKKAVRSACERWLAESGAGL